MKRYLAIAALGLALIHTPAHALTAMTCEPEWASLLHELGGDKVSVESATTAQQDVHMIEAKPSLIAKVRRADLIVCTGADLETGWLPQLLRQAGNAKVASGRGYFLAADQVVTLEKPAQLDRAAGDVHPQGNPHLHLDPYRMLAVANALTARLAEIDPANADAYRANLADFTVRWTAAIKRWEAKATPLKGRNVVVHHNSWIYLTNWLGMKTIGMLEPKPGVPPTSAHLASLVDTTKAGNTLAIIHAPYQDPKASEWLSQRTGVPVVELPFSVGGDARSNDLFGLYDTTIDKLLALVK